MAQSNLKFGLDTKELRFRPGDKVVVKNPCYDGKEDCLSSYFIDCHDRNITPHLTVLRTTQNWRHKPCYRLTVDGTSGPIPYVWFDDELEPYLSIDLINSEMQESERDINDLIDR